MVERQPTFVQDLCYSANDMRLMQAALVCDEGVAEFDQLRVTATSPVSGNVQVTQGHAFIANDNPEGTGDDGGMYQVYNDDTVTLAVPLNSSGVSRTDVVWAVVSDLEYAPVVSGFSLEYDDNNPTATPPADGRTYYLLATVVVPNGGGTGGTNITGVPANYQTTDGMITDNRQAYAACSGGALRQTIAVAGVGTSSDTFAFNKSNYPWLRSIRIRCVGGGGGGGGAGMAAGAPGPGVGAGGGGGGYCEKFLRVESIPAGAITITGGGGGAAGSGAAGSVGGTSSFGAVCSASGGSGGGSTGGSTGNDRTAAGGAGGTGSGGDFNVSGGRGSDIVALIIAGAARGFGGGGGSSVLGGEVGNFAALGVAVAGLDGRTRGGGGQGSMSITNGTINIGGNGAPGIVLVDLYG